MLLDISGRTKNTGTICLLSDNFLAQKYSRTFKLIGQFKLTLNRHGGIHVYSLIVFKELRKIFLSIPCNRF